MQQNLFSFFAKKQNKKKTEKTKLIHFLQAEATSDLPVTYFRSLAMKMIQCHSCLINIFNFYWLKMTENTPLETLIFQHFWKYTTRPP